MKIRTLQLTQQDEIWEKLFDYLWKNNKDLFYELAKKANEEEV